MTPTTTFVPRALQKGWKIRSEKAAAKTLAARDPARLLATRIRSMQSDIAHAGTIAQDEFAAFHAPVPSPIPQVVHRDVAALLGRFLEEHGLADRDLTAPIEPHESVAEIETRHRIRLQAEYDEGARELAEMERDRALERIRVAEAGLEAVDSAHASYGIAAEPAAVPETETPKRRGRPPKVVIDQGADVRPD